MQSDHGQVEIRLLNVEDSGELVRLAQRDSASLPPRPLLGGLVDGDLVAAYSIPSGRSIADPFRRTEEIRKLLAHWAKGLR